MADVIARVYRGDGLDGIHYGSVAVVDGDGKLTHHYGDPGLPVMARSSIKPFQLLPLITTGAADRFGFEPQQLAIMCGSHNGSDEHREVVLSCLEKSGCSGSDLQCGGHWPLGMQRVEQYPLQGEEQDPVRHNCSGKHSGFLALSKHLDVDSAEYLVPDSQTQVLVRRAIAEMTDIPEGQLRPEIDGCSAPNYEMPLRSFALGYMRLATGRVPSEDTAAALARIRDAMMSFPEMVSGKYRFDLDLMRSFPGRVVCKVGAEALEVVGFSDPPMGIAIKIHDGGNRARHPVTVAVLKQLGLIDDITRFPFLLRHEGPEIRNSAGLLTGSVQAEFELKEV